jgi:hypothetical protein
VALLSPVGFNACMLENAPALGLRQGGCAFANRKSPCAWLVQVSVLLKSGTAGLCQQSYGALRWWRTANLRGLAFFARQGAIGLVVEPRRIELLTSCVQGRRSPS